MAKKKKSTTKKLLIIAAVILAVFAIGAVVASSMGWIGGDETTVVQTAEAKYKTITQIVSASGTIQPKTSVVIRPEVSGKIVALKVDEGEYVEKGEVLVRIRQDAYRARIQEVKATLLTQKARLEQARANLIQARSHYKQIKELYQRNVASKAKYIKAKQKYKAAKASFEAAKYQVQSVKARLQQAKEDLQKTIIRAPRSGTITKLAVEEGEQVLGNARVAGTKMMSIAVMTNMQVRAKVNETDIVEVSVGDTAHIQVDAYPERTFTGVVTEIANSAQVTGKGTAQQVTNYLVKIDIITPHNLKMAGPRGKLLRNKFKEIPDEQFIPSFRPGMTATVDIETETVKHAVAIPIQSVTVRSIVQTDSTASDSLDAGNVIPERNLQKVVFLVKNGHVQRQKVKTGISDNTHIQIISGVEVGEEVVTGPYRILSERLEDGENVKVNNEKFAGFTR